MKFFCNECGLMLTHELFKYEGSSFGEADRQDFIQKGFYTLSDGGFFTGTEGCFIINVADLLNVTDHFDQSRLNGCCGLDGCDGPNKLCFNGHEIATEMSDCWMPWAVIFKKDAVFTK